MFLIEKFIFLHLKTSNIKVTILCAINYSFYYYFLVSLQISHADIEVLEILTIIYVLCNIFLKLTIPTIKSMHYFALWKIPNILIITFKKISLIYVIVIYRAFDRIFKDNSSLLDSLIHINNVIIFYWIMNLLFGLDFYYNFNILFIIN